jgi:hypothetical protein
MNQRVGPVAQVATAQLGRDGAGDRQVERGDLVGDGREGALEEAAFLWHCRLDPVRKSTAVRER